MTSARKIAANQQNARRSPGPKTETSRARSAANATSHGLNRPASAYPELLQQIDALALKIAGQHTDPNIRELARQIAEAQTDLNRVRIARYRLLALPTPDHRPQRSPKPSNTSSSDLATLENMLAHHRKLEALDRYEQRALSRRRFAIREFDAALRTLGSQYLPPAFDDLLATGNLERSA